MNCLKKGVFRSAGAGIPLVGFQSINISSLQDWEQWRL